MRTIKTNGTKMSIGTIVVTDSEFGFYWNNDLVWVDSEFPVTPVTFLAGLGIGNNLKGWKVDPSILNRSSNDLLEWKKGESLTANLRDVVDLTRYIDDRIINEFVDETDKLTSRSEDLFARLPYLPQGAQEIAMESYDKLASSWTERWSSLLETNHHYLGSEQYSRVTSVLKRNSSIVNFSKGVKCPTA